MITRLLPIVLVLSALTLTAHQKLKFNYDAAGNQVLRDWVCTSSLQAILPQATESLLSETPLEELMDKEKFGIPTYPNPVTKLLYANWEGTSEL